MTDLIDKIDKLEAAHLALIREKHDLKAALRAYAERERELVEALDCLTSNVEHAWPALANLGPVANARAILSKHKALA